MQNQSTQGDDKGAGHVNPYCESGFCLLCFAHDQSGMVIRQRKMSIANP